MSSQQTPSKATPKALLSAASISQLDEANNVAFASAGGDPLLGHQIAALRQTGIKRFLLEVDFVPGALLVLADRVRDQGCTIEFVRSIDDLHMHVRGDDQLLVQAEGVFAQPEFLASMLDGQSQFIATLDGRQENDIFERMDLNTRWAGLALISAKTVSSVEQLPEGWSIASSLLRQAMREGVQRRPVKQSNVQHGFLSKIGSPAEADLLTQQILASRLTKEVGFIEVSLLGPLAVRLAPLVWRSKNLQNCLIASMAIAACACLALAAINWVVAGIGMALVTILLNSIVQLTRNRNLDSPINHWFFKIIWCLLAAAVLVATRAVAKQPVDGIFAGAMLIGLATLAGHLKLPPWANNVLRSPALIGIAMLALTPMIGFTHGAKLIALAQIVMLVAAKWDRKSKL